MSCKVGARPASNLANGLELMPTKERGKLAIYPDSVLIPPIGVGINLADVRANLRKLLRCVPLLLLLDVFSTQVAADVTPARQDREFFEINWPSGRSGTENVELRIPASYGRLHRIAETYNRAMPANMLHDGPQPVHKDLLLIVLWPGLVPEAEENRSEFNQAGGGRRMSALLKSGAIEDFQDNHFNALKSEFDIAVDFSTKNICISPIDLGSTVTATPPKCYDRTAPDPKPAKYGLNRVGVDFAKYPDYPQAARSGLYEDDIYYLRSRDGDLQTVILCTAEEAKTFEDGPQYRTVPQCEQKFVHRPLNALVSIQYRRVYLQDWRNIQAAWEQLLDSFIVGHNKPQGKGK